ncbi:hypothetical protein NHX12_014010 [Muraenolepis orangiensis]|uniref:Ig-like domain-containing protein n=1 Tax=Muraenolepis orangiensis TaxID=630683 RepID=A0A9Q0DAN9_9TELE|nr:hypothetical protein NHX12_014010 [Muraenolepis orangiensis]
MHEDRQTFYKQQNPAYRGRTVLSEEDLERGIISLRLSRVRLADEGNYTCLFSSVHNQYTVQLLVGEAHSVMALVGDDVTLSYDTKQLTDISEETVEWSRTDLKPDLVHLHEDRRTFYKQQNPAYRGRTVLLEEDLERGIISLRLSRVRLADEGNYTCLFSSVHNQYTVQLLVALHCRLVSPAKQNSKVKQITQSEAGVSVFYQEGEECDLTKLSADTVLVPATAKVAHFIDFDPPLTTGKRQALSSVHYDSSIKIIVTFSRRFWEDDNIKGGKSITDRPSRFIYYPSHSFPENPDIGMLLASYTWSDDSLLFLGLEDEELKEVALRDLVLIHWEQVWDLCTGVVVKKWSSDPYSEAHSVMALVGDDVTLSYDTKQLKDISEETVEWSRADLKPDLVHLHEDRRTFYKQQNPAYRGRTVLSEEDLERGIISLRLSRVRLADEGNYTCLFSSVHNQYTVQLLVGEAHSVMALVGDDVTLSYDTKQLKDISEETVEWSRTDLKPDLVHLHEDHRTFYKQQNPAYRGRTVLSEEDLERGIISLRLSRVRLADEGNYTCLFSSVHNQYTVQLLVTVLEASGRVGGRVETYRHPTEGWYADLGAMRIPRFHHILLNYIHQLRIPLSEFVMDDGNTFYFVNGKRVKTKEAKNDPSLLGYGTTLSADQLLDQALKPKYDRYSVQEYLVEVAHLKAEELRTIGDLLNENSLMYTALTEMLYNQADINDSTQYFEVFGGSDLLPKALHGLLVHPAKLNSKVKQITQSEAGVSVLYQEGEECGLTKLSADAVLVTATVKATRFIDFDPPLTTGKRQALSSIHYDSSTKIILTFSQRFWENNGIKGGKSITDRPSRFIYYPSHIFPENPDIGVLLASYTWSDDSLLFLGLGDEELKEVALRDLVLIHGEQVRDLCTGVVVKKWSADPYSLGAFALFTPYQHNNFATELFQSQGRVHFAGEHTGFPHAWIETAIKTATRAAKNINTSVLDLLPMNEHQVPQGHLLQLLILQAQEEQGVVGPGVGGQQHADVWVLGKLWLG